MSEMQSLGKPDYMISGRPSTPITWPPTRSTVRNLKLAYKYRVATESLPSRRECWQTILQEEAFTSDSDTLIILLPTGHNYFRSSNLLSLLIQCSNLRLHVWNTSTDPFLLHQLLDLTREIYPIHSSHLV